MFCDSTNLRPYTVGVGPLIRKEAIYDNILALLPLRNNVILDKSLIGFSSQSQRGKMNYEGNGDSITVATDDNNNNESYIARESSPSKSRVCTLDLYTFLVQFNGSASQWVMKVLWVWLFRIHGFSFFLLSFSYQFCFFFCIYSLSYVKGKVWVYYASAVWTSFVNLWRSLLTFVSLAGFSWSW